MGYLSFKGKLLKGQCTNYERISEFTPVLVISKFE